MSKVAIYGGSFNPIHKAHTGLAKRFMEEMSLDEVVFVPTYTTPLKDNSDVISAYHRLKMCEAALLNCDNMYVSDVEIKRKGVSYTSDTIAYFLDKYTDIDLHLIMGADMFMTLSLWHKSEYIFENATILTAPRDDLSCAQLVNKLDEYGAYNCKAYISKTPIMDLSSTLIRDKLKRGENVSDYLDDGVISYINQNNLYR